MSWIEVGKSEILSITSPQGGAFANAFNFSNTDYWTPPIKTDSEGYLDQPVELYVTFNRFLNVQKFSMAKGLFNNDDFKYALGSPRDFEVYVSSTCIKEIPECIPSCTRPDPNDPLNPDAKILIDYAPNWVKVLDVKGRGTFNNPIFNKALVEAPFNMSTSLVYGTSAVHKETEGPSYVFDNFEVGGTRRINRLKVVVTRTNTIEMPSRGVDLLYFANMRLLGSR